MGFVLFSPPGTKYTSERMTMKTINISENELRRLLNEREDLRNNLQASQERCNELLEDTRKKGRHIKALEVEIEALRAVLPVKEEVKKEHPRKVWQPPASWKPPTKAELEEALHGPTVSDFSKQQGVRMTDVLLHLISKGGENINATTRISLDLLPEFKQKFAKKDATEDVKEETSSLPRVAIDSPHKQPEFKPVRNIDPFDVVLDGASRPWNKMRMD